MIHLIHEKIKTHTLRTVTYTLVVLVLSVVAYRVYAFIVLKNQTNADAIPIVHVITAMPVKGTEQLILPGNVNAWHDAIIYARVSGYIKKWYVDIGAKVEKDELLAEISAPEVDAQLRQAEADLNTAIANNTIAQSTAIRWKSLLKARAVSQQEADEKNADAVARKALVISAQANVDRLKEMVGFERVIAPFAGTITSRTTDIGTLINAGSSTNGVPLFQMAQTDPLRVYVKIPQNDSTRITPNMIVDLSFAEHPGQIFKAELIKTAAAIDPTTRTLLAQFKVDNKNGVLLAGSYTQVHLALPVPSNTYRLPVNVLLFQAAGLQIGIVDKNNRVVLKSIKIARDFGTEIEIDSGIEQGQKIIINPSDSITNGEKVKIS